MAIAPAGRRRGLARRVLSTLLRLAPAALFAYGLAEARATRVSRVQVRLERLKSPLRVAFLTDLHYSTAFGEGSVRRWVDAALAESPDVVLLGGDFVDQAVPMEGLARLSAELAWLEAPLGVHAVIGNHDRDAYPNLDALGPWLERASINLLVNEGRKLRDDVYLGGVDDLWTGLPDAALAFQDAPEDAAWLLLSHNPDYLPRVPERVDLTLSGHTHGGQIVLPVLGPVYTGSSYGARFAAGLVRGPALGYVSRGLGATTLPVRFACPPEIAILDLLPGL
ncbi:MAG TPA: metallophosphoesterase [Deinococcales bacterium]|nr:metallophosphoesterase [Deinococcales bacterium]